MNYIFTESRESTYISYILQDNKIFFEVGYKVLKNQNNTGFIKCFKIMHNGKIKLVYDVSKYKDAESFILSATREKIIKLIINIFKIVISVKENGFIEYRNINANLNSIYVDTNNLEVKLLYLPINIDNGKNEKTFLTELKNNILDILSSNSKYAALNNDIRLILNKYDDLKDIINHISNIELLKERSVNTNVEDSSLKTNIRDTSESDQEKIKDKKKDQRSTFSRLFFRKNKKDETKFNNEKYSNINSDINAYKDESSYDGTSLIDLQQQSLYSLKGINTPENIVFLINKSEYIIGSKKEYSDGHISFNKAVSRRHCKIININENYYLVDIGSSNGTFINGNRVIINEKVQIFEGDIIKIANSEFLFTKS